MSLLDIVLGLCLAYGLYKGFRNGFVMELAALAALIAGIFGVIHFSYIAADYLSDRLDWSPHTLKLASYVVTFLIIVVCIHLLGRLLTRVADIAFLGIFNRIAGAVFGLLKVAVILGALLIFFERANRSEGLVREESLENSALYFPLLQLGDWIFDRVLEPEIGQRLPFPSGDETDVPEIG